MKKLIILLVALLPMLVLAEEDSAKVVPIVPRCVYVTGNEITIPIEIISQNDGVINNKIEKYLLGKIDNNNEIKIKDVSDKMYIITIDSLKDSNGYSNVYFSLNNLGNDRKYKELGKVLSFNIDITLKEKTNRLYVLGTEVLLNEDKKICNKINYYNSKDLNDKAIVLNETNYVYFMIIGALVIIIMILIKRSDNKNAIYKNKN